MRIKPLILIMFAVFLIQIGVSVAITFPQIPNDIIHFDNLTPKAGLTCYASNHYAGDYDCNKAIDGGPTDVSRFLSNAIPVTLNFNFTLSEINATAFIRGQNSECMRTWNISYWDSTANNWILVTPVNATGWTAWVNPYTNTDCGSGYDPIKQNMTLAFSPLNTTALRIVITNADSSNAAIREIFISNSTTTGGGGGPDLTPPAISNVWNGSINATSVRINFTTNENSNASAFIGTTKNIWTINLTNTTSSSDHSLYTNALSPLTTYYYNLTACDAAGNCNSTGIFNFTTTKIILDTINVSSDSRPLNDSQFNVSIVQFYTYLNFTYNLTNCSLWINNKLNQTKMINGSSTAVFVNTTIYDANGDSYIGTGDWVSTSNYTNIFDNDNSTYGNAVNLKTADLYINYTKPSGSISAIWNTLGDNLTTTRAYSADIPSVCWNYDATQLQLRIRTSNMNPVGHSFNYWECRNNSINWMLLVSNYCDSSSNCRAAYEESLYWNVNATYNTTYSNYYLNFSQTFNTNGQYNYSFHCEDNETQENTTLRYFFIDTTFPAITLRNNNAFKSTNYSNENQYDSNMTINVTFSDDFDLYQYEINITKAGVIYYNDTNTTNAAGLQYNYTKTLNIASWPVGTYNIRLFASDGHTAEYISPYQVKTETSRLTFDTTEKNKIWIESEQQATASAVKEFDRYSFAFNFKDGKTTDRTFDLYSEYPLNYRKGSPFNAHFVVWNPKTKSGNWIDFEGMEKAYVEKVDDYHYKIQFLDMKPIAQFSSIGGLNVYSAEYSWYRGNYTLNSVSDFIYTPVRFSLNISYDSTIQNISAALKWNNTWLNVSSTNDSNTIYFVADWRLPFTTTNSNASYFWNITINQTDNTAYSFQTANITSFVYSYFIDNCTSDGNITMQFLIYNENVPADYANATTPEIAVAYSTADFYRNYSYTFYNTYNLSLCIYPSNKDITADVYVKYDSAVTNRYYLFREVFNGTPKTFPIYLINDSTGVSQLRMTLRNAIDYSYFKNIHVNLERYYVGENVWRVVQEDLSGDYGLVSFNIYERTKDYRLRYYNTTNALLKTSDILKFACSSGVCEITQVLNPLKSISAGDTIGSASFNNVSKVIIANFENSLGTSVSVNFTAQIEQANLIRVLCSEIKTGSSGSFSCNVTGYSGEVYVRMRTSAGNFYSAYINIGKQKLADFVGNKEGGLWAFFIVLICAMFGLFSPVGSIIAMIFGLIGIYFLGLLNPLTITALIVVSAMGILIGVKVRS